MSYENRYVPVELKKMDDHRIAITWADGAVTEYPTEFLRAKCPCAGCVDEWTGKVLVDPESVKGTGLRSMQQVGNYAFTIAFDDGHDTGIFTYKRLRELGEELAAPSEAPDTESLR